MYMEVLSGYQTLSGVSVTLKFSADELKTWVKLAEV